MFQIKFVNVGVIYERLCLTMQPHSSDSNFSKFLAIPRG